MLVAVLVLALTALVGLAAPPPGKGPKGKHSGAASAPAAASQYEYGPGGNQYGKNKVTICHKGKNTIKVAQPAVKAHLRHGDRLGAC